MQPLLQVARIDSLPVDLDLLVEQSSAENFRGVERLRDDWRVGSNRFVLPGEALFEARLGAELSGVCGLNQDPYLGQTVGRLRHLYVAPAHRRRGVGRALVGAVLAHARDQFERVCLRTDRTDADRFYLALGFEKVAASSERTHLISLKAG